MRTMRSQHIIWGMPLQTDNRHNIRFPGETQARPGLSVLVREGFVIGHYDLYRVPAWVAVRWTREDHDNMIVGSFARRFGADSELPVYARAGTDYEFATSRMERGHMARHADNEAWGEDNSDFGCRMSNIVPQHEDMNGEAWNGLEELHQDVVVDMAVGINTVWVISGPLFEDTDGDGRRIRGRVSSRVLEAPSIGRLCVPALDSGRRSAALGWNVDRLRCLRARQARRGRCPWRPPQGEPGAVNISPRANAERLHEPRADNASTAPIHSPRSRRVQADDRRGAGGRGNCYGGLECDRSAQRPWSTLLSDQTSLSFRYDSTSGFASVRMDPSGPPLHHHPPPRTSDFRGLG